MSSSGHKIKNQNVNGNDGEHVVKRYSFIRVNKDGTKEDLSKTMTIEELRGFLIDEGMVEEAYTITEDNVCAAREEDLKTETSDRDNTDDDCDDQEDLDCDEEDSYEDNIEDVEEDYTDEDEEDSDDKDCSEDDEDDEDDDDDDESDENAVVFVEVDDDQEKEDLEDEEDYDEVCPICGCKEIDYLDRGKMAGSIAGGVLGLTRNGIVKTFLPNIVSRGVSGVIGYAVGNVAGRVLDKKVLNNRKCTHCGYEWHVDEDLF